MAKLDIATDSDSGGRGFESSWAGQFMIIRTLSSKWGRGFGFLLSIQNILWQSGVGAVRVPTPVFIPVSLCA